MTTEPDGTLVTRPAASPSAVGQDVSAAETQQPRPHDALDRAGSFDEFYLGTRAQLLRQLTVMTADPELAKDVLQEAYARAWQRWERVAAMDQPTAWVRTVAWRLAVSQHRRVLVADRALRLLRVRPEQVRWGPESVVDVDSALRALSPAHRRTLVLHDMCGYTMDQIAAETGVPVGTVKSRLSRARAALAERLGPEYRGGSPEGTRREEDPWEA